MPTAAQLGPVDDPREHTAIGEKPKPVEDLIPIPVSLEHPERLLFIRANLSPQEQKDMTEFLPNNLEVFSWSFEDMLGISPGVISHKLGVNLGAKPVRQKRRPQDKKRSSAIGEDVQKLLTMGFIREVNYPEWLSNVVMVKKHNGKWRMCQDFSNLNDAYPKDSFPLPRIDQLVDATADHQLLRMMDAYSGYKQILMHPEDQEYTSFIADRGTYCHRVMPFGLKNAGATYQRLVNIIFADIIGDSMEVYVDDMLVKSVHASEHIEKLAKTFAILKKFNMRLNPAKCAFGVRSGKFLGFMVSQRGIETNPKKIHALVDMKSPKTTKEVQSLTGRVAALSRFISKATDKCQPFFKAKRARQRQNLSPGPRNAKQHSSN